MRVLRMMFLLGLAGLVIFMVGCAPVTRTVKTGTQSLQIEKYDLIKKGETDKAGILKIFGEPVSKTSMGAGAGEMWVYSYSETTKVTHLLASDEYDVTARSLVVTFDQNGIVRDFYSSEVKPLQEQQWEWK